MSKYTREELEALVVKQSLQLEKQKERTRKANERAKELWDTITCRVPKGTKQKIIDNGKTVNGLINELILDWLSKQESEANGEN